LQFGCAFALMALWLSGSVNKRSAKHKAVAPATAIYVCILLIYGAPVAEIAHAFAPRPVAAGLQMCSHQSFDLIGIQAMKHFYRIKAGMVTEGHFDDFAAGGFVKLCFFGHFA
jgi:hypothetical protein